MRRRQEDLEREVVHYKEQVSVLQDRLDSVTKVRKMKMLNGVYVKEDFYQFFWFAELASISEFFIIQRKRKLSVNSS